MGDEDGYTVLPILIHGDAAFAGQGVVAETLELSQLRGYRTGGTVHIVVNNQVGFTTAPESSRSSVYSTDVARAIQAPIFHVNGDDPEAVVRVGRLAFAYRQAFAKDVVIDMICYRRRGHNETDNPSFTQPLMYDLIDAKRSTRKIYTESLIGRGDITMEEAEQALRDYQRELERAFTETKDSLGRPPEPGAVARPVTGEAPADHSAVPTAISAETVKAIIATQLNMPDGFTPHPRLLPQLQRRAAMVEQDQVDWATGELLAFGSVLIDGHAVRLIGQDSRRGTFGQRHAVLVDRHTGEEYTPLRQFNGPSAKFLAYDSLLSEYAAVGFEYGYSVARPDALVCWEAQFGDFINGAQTIVDEFISSGEQKWGQRSGVVLMLPHGYEGQGPDHSSARIERFLSLCAQDNMTVAVPSTPASYFHLLRWQALSERIKPLIVFTPKSLLRLKAATSAGGGLHHRLVPAGAAGSGILRSRPGGRAADPAAVRRVLLCTGKVYYDLAEQRRSAGRAMSPCSGSSGSTRCRPPRSPPSWRGSRPPRRSPGSRRSPPTWAPGPTWACGCPASSGGPSAWSRCRPARLRRQARPRPTRPITPGSCEPPCSWRDSGVLHRPRHRGAHRAPRGRGGVAVLAGRAAARVHRRSPGCRVARGPAGQLAGPAR